MHMRDNMKTTNDMENKQSEEWETQEETLAEQNLHLVEELAYFPQHPHHVV